MATFALNDEAVGRGVMWIDIHLEDVVFVPDAFRVDYDAAGRDLSGEVAAQALQVLRRWLDRDHLGCSMIEGLASEYADVASAVEHDIAFVDGLNARAVDLELLFGEVEREDVLRALRNPPEPL